MLFIKNLIKRFVYFFKNHNKNVKFSNGVVIGGLKSYFEGNNRIYGNTFFAGELGFGSYIGSNCNITGKIGRYCSIASNVNVVLGSHPTSVFVSSHPAFFSTLKQAGFTYVNDTFFDENKTADAEGNPVVIGNDVWIGSGAMIISGVTIGDGAIIAAGAVVNKDVEPYTIVGGVPAKVIRKRFSENQIVQLLEIQWWNKSQEWIVDNAHCFRDIDDFLKQTDRGECWNE